ncbi:hypothetical protein DSECCO2_571420 [anaerobic digester metagenome]
MAYLFPFSEDRSAEDCCISLTDRNALSVASSTTSRPASWAKRRFLRCFLCIARRTASSPLLRSTRNSTKECSAWTPSRPARSGGSPHRESTTMFLIPRSAHALCKAAYRSCRSTSEPSRRTGAVGRRRATLPGKRRNSRFFSTIPTAAATGAASLVQTR